MKRTVVALATVLLVVTAGCAATPGTGTPATDGGTDGGNGAPTTDSTGSTDANSGTVNFYVSDQPNDMDDFEHLNVTITQVQFHLVDAADTESADETEVNETATPVETDDNETEESENESETDAEGEKMDEEDEESEDGRWVTREVNATDVDLSQLRGANATLLEQFDLPAGEYDKIHMEVSEVNGTLTNGESASVKLPSEKLQLNSQFTVENGSEVNFVYDVTVQKAGNSGKYVLKPVVSESGTDVVIERVDDEREDDDRSISASFLGNVSAGENVTVRVTENGSAVENATVMVDGEAAGSTDANGEYVLNVPSNAEELEIEVEDGDAEAELEAELDEGDEVDDDADGEAGASGDGGANARIADA
ncbi:hypothetical protein BRD06_09750 [Halobacteriales archaeon QS_9_67_15]|nr:MAG: hypothetical protein BRD06_09750 [Halobacteriales archaeon QS_9_67_15]